MDKYPHFAHTLLIGGLLLILFGGCSQEDAASQTEAARPARATASAAPLERLPESRAGEIVQRAIEAMGGWNAWTEKRTVAYRKTTLRLDQNGEVEGEVVQQHQYVLHPSPKMRITWEEDGRQYVLINNGEQAQKRVGGQQATAQPDRDNAWNATFGSHYVFAMPFKLTDPGTKLSYAGRDTLSDGTVADRVRTEYESWAGSAGGMHTWTYYFDVNDGRLVANHLAYGPEPDDYSFTEYADHTALDSLYLPTRRYGYQSNVQSEQLDKRSEIIYEDIRFNVPLPDSLFALRN